jgi:hypothetical protein
VSDISRQQHAQIKYSDVLVRFQTFPSYCVKHEVPICKRHECLRLYPRTTICHVLSHAVSVLSLLQHT